MRRLWAAFAGLATYVSLFPFDFDLSRSAGPAWTGFLASSAAVPSRGDLLGNVVLFVPYGAAGLLALEGTRARRIAIVLGSGFALALGLQCLQLALPSRDPSLQDVFWNVLGMVAGAITAAIVEPYVTRRTPGRARFRAVPSVLLLAWLADRWAPFVPSIDFQSIKDSVKPVLLDPVFDVGGIVRHAGAWLAVACLLRHVDRDGDRSGWLAPLAAVVFAGQIVIVHNVLGAHAVAGAAIAIAIWWAGLRRARRPERIVAIAFPIALAVGALTPLQFASEPTRFVWLPFGGFLDGSMWVNAHSALHKTFLYGALVYLPRLAGWPFRTAAAAAIVLVTAIEALQTRVVGHSPEITDPILVLAAAFAIVAVEAAERRAS